MLIRKIFISFRPVLTAEIGIIIIRDVLWKRRRSVRFFGFTQVS